MIDVNNISFEFGGRYLYDEANWHIKPNERIGLIGQNGTGKSTLLRMINGEYQVSGGAIQMHKNTTIGFLNQDLLSYESNDSIRDVAMQAFAKQLALQKEIEEVTKVLETDYSDQVLQRFSDLQSEFEALDGYNIDHKTDEILEGLGFTTNDLKRPLAEFSGGWRMRVMLAKLLLQKPDLLMLDEPTNHLDLPSIEWLEEYLKTYEGTVIIVSHDRYFLDRMVTKIVEVTQRKLFSFSGNYTFYLTAKKERDELQQKRFENQQVYIKQQERFIERFKAKASKATQAQSKLKQLDKLERIEAVEDDTVEINLRFQVEKQSGKVVGELKNVTKKYGDLTILKNADLILNRGDKVALIGANGKGKSTLLRIIAGTEPHEGEFAEGHNVIRAFYAQHQLESLNINNEILQEMEQYAPTKTEQELRTILGSFLFTGEDVFKKIKVLSGGEKARVALAKTLLTQANFLMLDEPTNHLDIQSINILVQALKNYEGSYIVVSHDRYFISKVANRIWWIEDEIVKEYPGTYDEFVEWNSQREQKQKAVDSQQKAVLKEKKEEERQQQKAETADKGPSKNEINRLKTSFEKMEQEIADINRKKEAIEADMSKEEVIADLEKVNKLSNQHKELNVKLEQLNKQYEEVFEQLVTLEEI